MDKVRSKNTEQIVGFTISLLGHVLLIVGAQVLFQRSAANFARASEVFSVTLEGGDRLGGISQVPLDGEEKKKVIPNAQEPSETEEQAEKQAEAKKVELQKAAAIEADKKKAEAEEKKKKDEAKKLEEKKKKDELEKKKQEEDKKKEQDSKKAAEDAKKKAIEDKKARDEALKRAVRQAANRYKGESANAGGEGFGAASMGGKGMGGGILQSAEFIAYSNMLESAVKSGWRWLPGRERLVAQVSVVILPNGVIQDVRILQSSGNSNYDDSIMRAIYKASPVPAAPAHLYDQFHFVNFTFDSAKG